MNLSRVGTEDTGRMDIFGRSANRTGAVRIVIIGADWLHIEAKD